MKKFTPPPPPPPPPPREIREGHAPGVVTFTEWFNKKFGWFFINGRKQNPNYEIELKGVSLATIPSPSSPTREDFEIVEMALANSEQMGVSKETVVEALLIMKQNPSLSIGEAITMGYLEQIDKNK